MTEEQRTIWGTLLTVTLATYLPFVWLLAIPGFLLAFGGLWIPDCVAGQVLIPRVPGLGQISLLCQPFVWTVLTLSFFTWLGRRGGRMRVIATMCAFAWALLQSAGLAFILANFHT